MALVVQPSWLPTANSVMEAIEQAYQEFVPEQWPKGLRFPGTVLHLHRKALGVGYSWLSMAILWWTEIFWPDRDDGAELGLPRWERIFGLSPLGTIDERQRRVTAAFRNRGTLNLARLRAIVAPAFGNPSDLTDIQVSVPDFSTVIADQPIAADPGWRDAYFMHVHVDGTAHTLNEKIGDAVVAQLEGAGFKVQIGEDLTLTAGMPINRGVVGSEP